MNGNATETQKSVFCRVKSIHVGAKSLTAQLVLAEDAPTCTSEDPLGTARLLRALPGLAGHLCLGDRSHHFGRVIENTETVHLLEHVAVELLALTDLAGDVSAGRTIRLDERRYCLKLTCLDDLLTAAALTAAIELLQAAYVQKDEPLPDVEGIVLHLRGLLRPQ